MLQLSCFSCDTDQDPYNVCPHCGYPMCPGCGAPSECYHNEYSLYGMPQPLKKRLKGDICEYLPAQIVCHMCSNSYCVDCYEKYALRFTGKEFIPKIGWRYTKKINRAALGLFMLNERLGKVLPKDILLKVVEFL